MELKFDKYHGAGNDFIIIDGRFGLPDLTQETIASWCKRATGIGADGLIIVHNNADYDFEMKYYNADGREGSMCGNGGRCIAAFANKLGLCAEQTIFLASDGLHHATIHSDTLVSLAMNDASIPEFLGDGWFVNTGSPHLVLLVENIDTIDMMQYGKELRFNNRFAPDGTNVNVIQEKNNVYFIRTYERGVEAETLSCGTGAVAAALSLAAAKHINMGSIELNARGGLLMVSFNKKQNNYTDIVLHGPVHFVYSGQIQL